MDDNWIPSRGKCSLQCLRKPVLMAHREKSPAKLFRIETISSANQTQSIFIRSGLVFYFYFFAVLHKIARAKVHIQIEPDPKMKPYIISSSRKVKFKN